MTESDSPVRAAIETVELGAGHGGLLPARPRCPRLPARTGPAAGAHREGARRGRAWWVVGVG